MKMLSLLFIGAGGLVFLLGAAFRLMDKQLMGIPPQSFLEFTTACLLFSIAISLHRKD
ncbi:MAG: hypothetical protein WC980_05035 [Candidatus Brocadiia bacterium]